MSKPNLKEDFKAYNILVVGACESEDKAYKVFDEMSQPNLEEDLLENEGTKAVHHVFDEMPKPVPTDVPSSYHPCLSKVAANSPVLEDSTWLEEVDHSFPLKLGGVDDEHQLFDKVPKQLSLKNVNGNDFYEQLGNEPVATKQIMMNNSAHYMFDEMLQPVPVRLKSEASFFGGEGNDNSLIDTADLKSKPAFRAKFGVKDEWVLPFEIIPIINHPDFGDKSAERICIDKKIKSQNERDKLDEAKKIIYKGGFYEGTMIAGEYAGLKVQEAKSLIRNMLLMFMFDPGIRSWHHRGCACIKSNGVKHEFDKMPADSNVEVGISEVLLLVFDPGGNSWGKYILEVVTVFVEMGKNEMSDSHLLLHLKPDIEFCINKVPMFVFDPGGICQSALKISVAAKVLAAYFTLSLINKAMRWWNEEADAPSWVTLINGEAFEFGCNGSFTEKGGLCAKFFLFFSFSTSLGTRMFSRGREGGYAALVIKGIGDMICIDDEWRRLNASLRLNRVGSIFGIWCNEENDNVYVVFEKFTSCLMKEELVDGVLGEISVQGEQVGLMGGFGMVGMELCEVINDLNVEGFVIGCLGLKSFSYNQLGRVSVNFADVLLMGRRFFRNMSEMGDLENMVVDEAGMKDCIFLSPEVAATLLERNIRQTGDMSSLCKVGYGSDVWSLACLLIFILVGNSFVTYMHDYYHDIFTALVHQNDVDYVTLYTDWVDKVINMLEGQLGSEFFSLKKILLECLSFNSESRPVLTALWNCLKELVIKPEFDLGFHPKREMLTEMPRKCIVLGSLCSLVSKNELDKVNTTTDDLPEKEETGLVEVDQVEGLKAEDAIIEAFSKGNLKCIELKAHVDCVSGLAVGGGFLFSSSHDKSVNVWSLQDFSLVHTFKGHEDRVTAVLFIEGDEPLCVSADKGGVICIWAARNPLDSSPMKKLFEPKDWRFSGIHALAFSGTHYLYTGSGDRTIKVWSLQDYALINTMTGHKSVVCALAVSNGVLYSGSWDGTVRLWSLSDHNPLAVLGEDVPGNPSSVLSIAAEDNMLIVAHEDGSIKTWYESRLLKSRSVHNRAVFSVCRMGSWLFTGGWDKTVNVQFQDMSLGNGVEEDDGVLRGSISTDSVVTSLAYFEGKLFVGLANRLVKVYYHGV